MSILESPAETVSFTDLSKRPAVVAEKAARLGCVRITHRDGPDMVLTTAALARLTEDSLTTAARLVGALARNTVAGDLLPGALTEVFPWVRHLGADEQLEFANELLGALSDDAELGTRGAVHRAIVSWRATARIYADPEQLKDAMQLVGDDLGSVEVVAE